MVAYLHSLQSFINQPYVIKHFLILVMECMTLYYYDKDGNRHEKPKKSYETDKEAIYQARILNSLPTTIHKLVAYKCPSCLKWHIGRTKKELTDKEREHYKSLL